MGLEINKVVHIFDQDPLWFGPHSPRSFLSHLPQSVCWNARNDLPVLAAICRKYLPLQVCEIGTHQGHSTQMLLDGSPCHVTTISLCQELLTDRGLGVEDKEELFGHFTTGLMRASEVGSVYKLTGNAHRVTQLLGNSLEIVPKLTETHPNFYDMGIVDGCHDYDYVNLDTGNLLQVCKVSAPIVFHDFQHSPEWDESGNVISGEPWTRPVTKFIYEFCSMNDLELHCFAQSTGAIAYCYFIKDSRDEYVFPPLQGVEQHTDGHYPKSIKDIFYNPKPLLTVGKN